YFGNIHLLVSGASLINDHYRFLTVNILLLWPIIQRRHLYTTPTVPINCITSETVGWHRFLVILCHGRRVL
ncbi:unnamed protein product, partial [Brassica oleracea]